MSCTTRYVRWQHGDVWLGYFEQFPEYLTQGESLGKPEDNLRDLYRDGLEVPGIRGAAGLVSTYPTPS